MAVAKWNTPSLTTVLSSQLDGLPNAINSLSNASSVITNASNLDLRIDAEVFLNTYSPSGGNLFIYIQEAVDGTNFPSQSIVDIRLCQEQLLGMMWVGSAAAATQRVVHRGLLIPPGSFTVKLENRTGATFNVSGNTLKFLSYNVNLTA